MSRYALYCRTKYLATRGKRIAWRSLVAVMAALVLQQELAGFGLAGHIPRENLYFLQAALWTILTITGVFVLCRYPSSREYQFFRSLPLPRTLRSYLMGCQVLPVLALYIMGACILWSSRQGSPSVYLLQQLALLLAACTLLSHVLLAIRTATRRSPSLSRMVMAVGALLVVLGIGAVDLRPLFSLRGALYAWMYHQLFTVRWYVLLPCGLWLFYYFVKAPGYETGSIRRPAIRRKRKSKVRGGLYANLLYKDWVVASQNPIILLFCALAVVLALVSLKYRFNGSINVVIGLVYTFIASALSEEIMKDDMAALSFFHTLPIKQRDFYNCKMFSVATVVFLPSALFWLLTALGGGYSPGEFVICLTVSMAYHFSLCAMLCAILMKYRHSPGRAQAYTTVLLLGSILLPLLPAVYLLLMYKKARAAFCGGRS